MIIRFVKNSDREQVFILLDELISEAVRAGNLTMPVVDTIIRNKFFDEVIKRNDIKVIKLTSSLELQKAHEFYEKNGGEFTEKLFRFEL